MHEAVQHELGRIGKVKYLLSKGVDPGAEDQNLKTALDVAASKRAKDVLQLFARGGQVTAVQAE